MVRRRSISPPCRAIWGGYSPPAPRSVGEAGEVLLEDGPERRLGAELAEHADAAEPRAVDEEVRRGQVELEGHGVRRLPWVVDPLELALHPLPREAEALDERGLDEGREVV